MSENWCFVLGVQKCGTTTVHDLLGGQPEVFVPSIKETHFFCRDELFSKGHDWFMREFYDPRFTRGARLFCDATPFYFVSEKALRRLAAFAPDARHILIFRDPVRRAYSAYWQERREGGEALGFEDALDAEPERLTAENWWHLSYLEVSRYGRHLEQTFDILGRDRVLLLHEPDLADMASLQRRLRGFLGLPPLERVPQIERSNPSSMPRSRVLQDLLIRPNPAKRIIQAVVPREIRTRIGKRLYWVNQRRFDYPPMAKETEARIKAELAADIARFRALSGIEVEKWGFAA